MKKTIQLSLLVACVLGVAPAAPTLAKANPEREIVLLILVDALRPDHMGAYGYDKPTTPEMDKLAAQGTRYTRAYVNAPWTRPSTASFLTGLNASRHRTQSAKTKLPEDVSTIAQLLKKQGWTTAAFVANGNGGSLAGLHKGFDLFEDPTNTYTKSARGKTYNGLPTGEFLVQRATDWLKKSPAEKIFLFMFLVDPHDPYYAPPELEKMFLGNFKGEPRRRALWEANNTYPEAERQSMVAIYDAAIRYSDQALGQLFGTLKTMQLYDNATIMITADHGEGFGEHGFYLHAHHFWDEVVKVPLIVKGPKFATKVDNRLVDSIDMARTVVDLAGANATSLPGHSLLEPASKDKRIISEYNEFGIRRQAIVGERYKVIWQRPALEEVYLREAKKKEYFPSVSFDKDVVNVFDLQHDPQEKNDLAATMPAEAKALLEQLRAFVLAGDG